MIYCAGGIRGAVESGSLRSGILFECVRHDVPFVLAGSLRDDGPLPDTITDMNAAQDAYAEELKGAGIVLCLGSMLHSIAVGEYAAWLGEDCVRRHQPRCGDESEATVEPGRRSGS